MENMYGIGVANRYALFLDDESDPMEVLKSLKEHDKEAKRTKTTKMAATTDKENNAKNKVGQNVTTANYKGKTESSANSASAGGGGAPGQLAPRKNSASSQQGFVKVQEHHKQRDATTQIANEGKVHYQSKFNKEEAIDKNNSRFEGRYNHKNREDKSFNNTSFETRSKDRDNRRDHFNVNNNNDQFETRYRDRSTRFGGPGGNRGMARGGGPKRNFEDRRGKREFDRQSGSDKTGVKPVDKRDGGGAHNWGSHKDVIEDAAEKPQMDSDQKDWEEQSPKSGDNGIVEQQRGYDGTDNGENCTTNEDEPKELTLDEWKAQRAGRVKPQYNIRKAGEGEDPDQWEQMYELRKKNANAAPTTSDESDNEANECSQRSGRQKQFLEIDIQFNDNNRRGFIGGRGGRGPRIGDGIGYRGNRLTSRGPNLRGSGSMGYNMSNSSGYANSLNDRYEQDEEKPEPPTAPKVDDERAFPSLG